VSKSVSKMDDSQTVVLTLRANSSIGGWPVGRGREAVGVGAAPRPVRRLTERRGVRERLYFQAASRAHSSTGNAYGSQRCGSRSRWR